jgi:oligopeptide transport system substrate-binding protein
MSKRILIGIFSLLMLACSDEPLNDPYRDQQSQQKIFYSSFAEQPKTLDPARSYSSNESLFTAQVYEPPLQYHYLLRPYTLVPLTATQLPTVTYYNAQNQPLADSAAAKDIAYSVYDVFIQPQIFYQPHPAFAQDAQGNYLLHNLTQNTLEDIEDLADFKIQGTRELTAADYVYQIKRLAHPELQSPIFGLMSAYIVGLNAFAEELQQAYDNTYLDLREFTLPGAEVVSRYHYRIRIQGKYPQFIYWLAMPFFSPMPWEADKFYSQAGLQERNISLDWYPVGTGPFMLSVNNPNKEMLLVRNPNFRLERFPEIGTSDDQAQGYLRNAGKPLPFLQQIVFSLEKESIPRWTEFLQGYYDTSSITADSFDQAVRINAQGQAQLTPAMQKKALRLHTSVEPATYYMGFNMLDNRVGGQSEAARKLRQAISIAVDYQDFIALFLNGRGVVAHGPLPPGIFGYREHTVSTSPSLAEAKQLLSEAGYVDGIDPRTGQALILHYDTVASGGPDDKARLDWMRKQFAKLGIQLNIRATSYNRFQEKMRLGNAQIFSWGWLADYPDPENFMFLLYGANGKVKHGGENAANYHNPRFDRLFDQMKNLANGPQRQQLIDEMLAILQHDAPWIWGFHPMTFSLAHQWVSPTKTHALANNTFKYIDIDVATRKQLRQQWNHPIWWPVIIGLLLLLLVILPIIREFKRRENKRL